MNIDYNNNESAQATAYKLDCLYAGKDIIANAMKNAIYHSNSNSLERQIDDELNLLLLEVEEQERKDAALLESMLLQDENDDDEDDRLETLASGTIKSTTTSKREQLKERSAFKQQSKRLSNLMTCDFKKDIQIKAVIDFIGVQFTTDKAYSSRSDLKSALTKASKHKYFVKEEADENTYSIRLHDIKNKKDLLKRLQPLSHFNKSAELSSLQITCIERAIDFHFSDYSDEKAAAFALALFKGLRLSSDIHNTRFYRKKGEVFKLDKKVEDVTPFTHNDFIWHFLNDYNVAINDVNDDFYYHIYIKKTDTINGSLIELSQSEWRVRCELRAQNDGIVKLLDREAQVKDLSELLKSMSSHTKFVKLKDDIHPCVRNALDDFPRLCGKERSKRYNANRHAQPQLSKSTERNGAFNGVLALRQESLAKKFAC